MHFFYVVFGMDTTLDVSNCLQILYDTSSGSHVLVFILNTMATLLIISVLLIFTLKKWSDKKL